ncbi:MAG: hypothetical protein QHH19_02465 [Candidatus Thermoplasmatota archaeon]|jgi:uncharacterized protein|nr:hypothetical protein [Candidatus Thermoplasmatota archaeon]
MIKKLLFITMAFLVASSSFCQYSLANSPGEIYEGKVTISYRNCTVYAPAVAKTDKGYVGVISTITVTIQSNGSGRVFVDTLPLTEVDMQGSARLAVKVAGAFVKKDINCTVNPSSYDFFFVVRTSSPIIGGPSAGAVMTLATIALLENWTIDDKTVMTGMINPDGSIGPIGGIPQKIDASASVGATRFLIPKGQMTYTELVTETTRSNGWTQIITRPVTRNVSDYAIQNYGIEVFEVSDIEEAVYYFTGYKFSSIESDKKITTKDYIDSMKPLAETLLNESKKQYANASDLLNHTSIPNRYPYYYKNSITDFINNAEDKIAKSQDSYEHGFYYSSTSNSFQSLIDSRFVIYACGYFNSSNPSQYVTSLVNEVTSFCDEKSDIAKNSKIKGVISLQCVGAAQNRASEAKTYLDDASESYKKNDYLSALYKIAFAMERSKSIGWWLDIASHFNDTGEVNVTMLTNIAEEYIDDAQQAIVYSSLIIQEMGETSSYLSDAKSSLETARDDIEQGYPAAALFDSLEALVKANLALELVDGITTEKIERARERASNSISKIRNMGIEPVLAVSYYEYAESLMNESKQDSAIVYYKYSDFIAGAINFGNFSTGATTSRYVGIPKVDTENKMFDYIFSRYSDYLAMVLVIGIIFGLGIGLLASGIISKRKKDKFYEKWAPRSITEYYKKNK